MMKRCSRCLCTKPIEEFDEKTPGVPKTRCRKCLNHVQGYYQENKTQEIARAVRNQNKDRDRTNAYKRGQIRKHPERYLHHAARSRARKLGIPFNLEVGDIQIPAVCPILGIPLAINTVSSGPNSPSLDRIIPGLGYVKGNVIVISHRANTIKSDASLEELRKMVIFLEKIDRRNRTETHNEPQT